MKIRRELWFGLVLLGLVIGAIGIFTPWSQLTNGHVGLIMLAGIVVAILLGFPTAFTLMGMGVLFAGYAYYSRSPDIALRQVLDLTVQRTFGVMSNELLIAVPLFVFMGYLVERAALIDRLFRSLHLALARIPGSLAVATIATCAIFATATGIVGAVVTLMGLLALPQMLRAGYDVRVSSGSITAGGCLGILIPPSVLLILYGATAGVSVVKLYAGALIPGLMLATLYIGYVIVLALLRPDLLPPLSQAERKVELSPLARALAQQGPSALRGLAGALRRPQPALPLGAVLRELCVVALPLLVVLGVLVTGYTIARAPGGETAATQTLAEEPLGSGSLELAAGEPSSGTGLEEPPAAVDEAAPATGLAEPPGAEELPAVAATLPLPAAAPPLTGPSSLPRWFWVLAGLCALVLALGPRLLTWERVAIFKLLLSSFFPLAILILGALGSILFGLATPTEAAAVGALGGFVLAGCYQFVEHWRSPKHASSGAALRAWGLQLLGTVRESAYLTAKTSAMVCWLFVGSALFSAAFALLGGQEIIERWVLSLDLSPVQFMLLAQVIIFLLGWPLEWTEIIVIFMPIFLPLLGHFHINPLFFGLLVALNLQTAFLSPPVAMAAFYLKGVAPPHVRLAQIFSGMMPFMGIQVLAILLLYLFPQLGLWLPEVLYSN